MAEDYITPPKRKVLVIGNGFDVALGLPTRYIDFMEFVCVERPIELVRSVKSGNTPEEKYKKFFKAESSTILEEEISRFESLRRGNFWAQYYRSFQTKIKGWIDLEREMIPVLRFFAWLFEQEIRMHGDGRGDTASITTLDEDKYRLAGILPKFISRQGASGGIKPGYNMDVRSEYCDKQYGIRKDKIVKDLIKDLDNFIEMFRIYLREFVCNAERDQNLIIENLKADRIINFNYVQSEMFLPNLKDAETIHVHGDTTNANNMVLGVNEVPNDPKGDFLYFTKSFQRIKIKANPKYREFWEGPFDLTFFGHSLDMTDIDIIKPLYEHADHVKVFYYKDRDYEDKILNLIKMIGIKRIEEDNYSGRLELISSKS